jgi:hypothetical protein
MFVHTLRVSLFDGVSPRPFPGWAVKALNMALAFSYVMGCVMKSYIENSGIDKYVLILTFPS